MKSEPAYAKLNLALAVGPPRPDGRHEVVTVLQAIDLHDDIELEPAPALAVEGFEEDTLVRAALGALARHQQITPSWRVRIRKRIPVAAGLGGGSSDAATALRLANSNLPDPVGSETLHEIAAEVGADVPFFLGGAQQLGTGDGTTLSSVLLPVDYVVLLVLPADKSKESTASVYRGFDTRDGSTGFDERRAELLQALEAVRRAEDLAALPGNDLASSRVAEDLRALGAFRADATGAGPAVYGLFPDEAAARRAAASLRRVGPAWIARPLG
jgi:4-diphosphocytidyl-2-C-methyl-D-erythritol kinase